jgi:APA family basic amino acid/polyamine antiporter
MYHYLKEAYGTFWGFLYGWACFLVIMSGGIAALAVAFGEYLGSFLPLFSTRNILFSLPIGGWSWSVSGGQIAGALAILLLTAVNHIGLREGAMVQNFLVVFRIGSIVAFVALAFSVDKPASASVIEGLPEINLFAAVGTGMIAALWTYDGWYGATFSAGEMRDPQRSLPFGLVWGTVIVMVLYALINLVYFVALPLDAIAETPRIGETAAAALFGNVGGRLMSFAILVSIFGGLLFHVGTAGAVIVLRRRRPDVERSYRVWGYPWVPLLFILASILLVGNTLVEKPAESLFGLVLIAAGVPAYMWWRRHPTPDSEVKS